jgi:hypothetical protein
MDLPLDGIAGDALELQVTFRAGGTDVVGVEVRRSVDGAELTTIRYDSARSELSLDTRRSGTDPDVGGGLSVAGRAGMRRAGAATCLRRPLGG